MSIPPAWHPDPTGRHDHRWWDGTRWTEHVADAGVAAVDPLDQPATPGGAAGSPGGQTAAAGGQPTGGAWGATTPSDGGWSTAQPAAGGEATAGAPRSTDGLAVAALVVGIVSLVTSFAVFGGLGGVVAIVLGAIAMGRVRRSGRKGRGMAITGLVTGIVSVLVAILFVVFFSQFFGTFFGDYQDCLRETGGDTAVCERRMEQEMERRFFGD